MRTKAAAIPAFALGHSFLAALMLLVLILPISAEQEPLKPETALFPSGCNLLLVNGLPGDVESESTFREQTQAWADLAALSGKVRKLVVLSDNPEAVKLPQGVEAKALKASRENFLDAARELKAQNAPLVVIAWGHGGKQRSTSVLHVRGPRLSPDDFKQLASQAAAPVSHWILIFKGSGAFGKALAAEGRAIITSESETAFGSDPMAMPLLLKLARDGNVSFATTAENLGRAVAEWYSQRRLARTEDPTLWPENGQPILLAKNASSLTPAGGSDEVPIFGETENHPANAEKKAPRASTAAENAETIAPDSIPAWKGLQKVTADKYPDADAVVLIQRSRTTLGSNPAIVTEQEQFIQILKPEGKRFGDFDVSYSPPGEEVQFLETEVLMPNGQLTRLDPEKIVEVADQDLGDYRAPRRKMFSLPAVEPGAVLHVRFRTQWKQFPLPRISLELPVGHELPALRSEVEVSVSKAAPFHFAFEHVSAPDPEVKSTSYSTTYRWVLPNLPAHKNESLTAPRQTPTLMVSTFSDWKEFAQWYERISRLTAEVTPEIAAKAKQLTAGAKTEREKLITLYNYVTGLRYVALPLGINSVRPHAAANVLRNQFGDCKDKANLLNAMLQSLQIEAHLVLVPRFSQAHDSVPGLAFNHAISQVKLGPDTLWLDTTDDICRFGLLPPGDPGRNVLPIDGKNSALIQMPAPEPKDHRLTITGEVGWSESAEGAPTELQAAAFGYPDYQLRASARDAREHRSSMPLLAARFRPVAGVFALEKQTGTAVSALDQDFHWSGRGNWVGVGSRSGSVGLLQAPFWLPREWDLALHQRHAPLYLNQGYPLTLEQEFHLELPAAHSGEALPRVCENSQGPLRWRIAWTKLNDDKLAARVELQLQKGELSAAETAVFQDQLRTLLAAVAIPATFRFSN